MYVWIYVCSSVTLKLFIRFWWIWYQSIRCYDLDYIGYILTDFNNTKSRFYLVNTDFNRFHFFIYYATDVNVMEVLFPVKIFDVECSTDLYVLKSSESKKVDLEIGLNLCVCMCMCVIVKWVFRAIYLQN